ncbi:MAG: tRNA (N(6)-L-threonylcarbamoyladenosine(37)-C(2))-methylthiotransferase MtaB [Clostridia bacterium]|nr:tRNA (N(6)-L-threonylcarbamoyladenosine(37)-C(2))-methylthiotransferase MtaB [Clostridia bacterium]
MYTVGLYTLGCKVSQYETEAIAEAFEKKGFRIVPFEEVADVYVINTCTVTAESDRKCRQIIRRATGKKENALVMVVGCYAQTSSDEILKIPGVSYVSGTNGKLCLPDRAVALLSRAERTGHLCETASLEGASFEPMCITRAPRTRAYVKIEDGCECRCTYCAIPDARGNVRSKRPEDVLAEIEGLVRGGTREVVLTGIETASYGADLDGFRLIDLLEMLDGKSSVERIRLGSLTPEMMREETVSRLSHLKKLVPHFHLSMQSGSDSVLRGMKRRYNAKMATEALARLREAIPDVQFTTDIMVGFPGETDEAFDETFAFCQAARFLDMHVFAYSKRKNTPAARMADQVAEPIKKQRSAALLALRESLRKDILADLVKKGEFLSVLFETEENGSFVGHSDAFVPVRVETKEDLHGQLRLVKPLSVVDGVLCGELIWN